MYRTYKTDKIPVTEKNGFEECLIPKEVQTGPVKICNSENASEIKAVNPLSNIFGGAFDNIQLDDILILGILVLLFYENCEDNLLIIILVALLFIK